MQAIEIVEADLGRPNHQRAVLDLTSAVLPELRGKGIGRQLLGAVEEKLARLAAG